jgi:hypothetical protein
MIRRPGGRRLTSALVLAAALCAGCAPDDAACDLEPTSPPVEFDEPVTVEVSVPLALADIAGDGVYAGPQLEPIDHGGIIWESPEIIADSFMRLPAYLTVNTSEAVATQTDPQTLQLVMSDGAMLILRPADCT